MRRLLLLAVLVLIPAAVAQAALRRPPASVGTTVTEQVGIGVLKPGPGFGSDARVKRLLGKPDRPGQRIDGKPTSLDYRKKFGLRVFFDGQRTGSPLVAIEVTRAQFRTKGGVRVGGTLSDIRRAYPDLPMPCGRSASNPKNRICSILEPQDTDQGATSEETQFVFRDTRIASISVSSQVR